VLNAADKIDIDYFRGKRNPALANPSVEQPIKKLTRKMCIDNSLLAENLDEITTLMLREQKITIFNDNLEDEDDDGRKFKMEDLCNLECLMASHNFLKDINGIVQLTTLVELNLSYNRISEVTGIEELTQLRALHLNHNKVSMIDSVAKLLNLKQLGLFYNDVIDSEHAMSVLVRCTKLKELSIDGNPCSRSPEFGYELLMCLPGLKVYNEEPVKELDRDVAEQYYEMYELPVPQPWKPEVTIHSKLRVAGGDGQTTKERKCVRFHEVDADDIEECGHEKDLKELTGQVAQLELEKHELQRQLTKTNYDEVYRENERLQQ
jgi:Leucine-rich repeat (LRR) protein